MRDYRSRAIAAVRDRWHAILPAAWTLRRDVGAQIAAFADHLEHEYEAHPDQAASRLLRGALDRIKQSGVEPRRTSLFAQLASERSRALPHELSRAALVVQMAYFDIGARTQRSLVDDPGSARACKLFPGRFAHFLRDKGLLPADRASPYEWDSAPDDVYACWGHAGLDSRFWSRLSMAALFQVATSAEWIMLRRALRCADLPAEAARELAARFAGKADICGVLGQLGGVLREASAGDVQPAPASLPLPWRLASQVALATRLPEVSSSACITLDLRTSTMSICPEGPSVKLHSSMTLLLTLLVIAGDDGLTLRDAKQLTFDLAKMDEKPERWLVAWTPQSCERGDLDNERLNRLNVLKHRTNKELGKLGVRIDKATGRGVWRLVHPWGDGHVVHLTGALWELLSSGAPPARPRGLPKQQEALWDALATQAPCCVSLESLAEALGKVVDKRGPKQVLDALRKLNQRLIRSNEPVRVRRVWRAHYALVQADIALRGDLVAEQRRVRSNIGAFV